MEFEAKVVTGKDGERVALERAAAVRRVLAWIAGNRVSMTAAMAAVGCWPAHALSLEAGGGRPVGRHTCLRAR